MRGHRAIYVVNTDGSGQRRLARGWPSDWSPDGQKIAFTEPGRTSEIYVMNADGSDIYVMNADGRADSAS